MKLKHPNKINLLRKKRVQKLTKYTIFYKTSKTV